MSKERSAAWLRLLTEDQRTLALSRPHYVDAHREVLVFDEELPDGFPADPAHSDQDAMEDLAEEEGELSEEADEKEDHANDFSDAGAVGAETRDLTETGAP